MNMLLKTAASVASAAFVFSGFAAVEAPFEVGDWGNFCKGAVSHTFDDNTAGQISKGQPVFDEKGFHMTMFVVTGWGPDWGNMKSAFAKGHEIASHSQTHGGTMSDAESAPSQSIIKENVPGEKCVTVAYPNCNVPNPQTNLKQCYIAGRVCDGQIGGKTPNDWYRVSAIICGSNQQNGNSAQSFNSKADQAANSNGWLVWVHHGVGSGDHSYATTDPNHLKDHMDYLDQNRDKIWCETFGNVARYIKERNAASIAVTTTDDNGITLTVTDNLPDSIFNYPLSIRRPLPDGWDTAVVTQNGKDVENSIVMVDSKKYVMFKAIPDSGDILISKGPTSVANRQSRLLMNANSPVVYKNSSLLFNRDQLNGSNMAVTILNLNGRVLASHRLSENQSSIALQKKITQSAFIVKVTGNNRTYTQTFIPQM